MWILCVDLLFETNLESETELRSSLTATSESLALKVRVQSSAEAALPFRGSYDGHIEFLTPSTIIRGVILSLPNVAARCRFATMI